MVEVLLLMMRLVGEEELKLGPPTISLQELLWFVVNSKTSSYSLLLSSLSLKSGMWPTLMVKSS